MFCTVVREVPNRTTKKNSARSVLRIAPDFLMLQIGPPRLQNILISRMGRNFVASNLKITVQHFKIRSLGFPSSIISFLVVVNDFSIVVVNLVCLSLVEITR
jgi:hypothetical protein